MDREALRWRRRCGSNGDNVVRWAVLARDCEQDVDGAIDITRGLDAIWRKRDGQCQRATVLAYDLAYLAMASGNLRVRRASKVALHERRRLCSTRFGGQGPDRRY